jgi:hypothetical protein
VQFKQKIEQGRLDKLMAQRMNMQSCPTITKSPQHIFVVEKKDHSSSKSRDPEDPLMVTYASGHWTS